MAESIFKVFGPQQYSNLKIKGFLEYKLTPWEVIFEVVTKITPTLEAKDRFKDVIDFREWVRANHLGKKILLSSMGASLLPKGWTIEDISGFGYSYEHSLRQLTYNSTSNFNLTLHIGAPQKTFWKELIPDFKIISKLFSESRRFQTNKFIQFTV